MQVSAAAKGAEAQSPGVTLRFVIKSGSNKFSGMYLAAWQDGAFQGNNISDDLRNRGYDPGNNKFTRYNDFMPTSAALSCATKCGSMRRMVTIIRACSFLDLCPSKPANKSSTSPVSTIRR